MQVADHRRERQTRDVGSEQGKIWKRLSVSRSLSSLLYSAVRFQELSFIPANCEYLLSQVHECSFHRGCESSIDRACNSESASNVSLTEASTVYACANVSTVSIPFSKTSIPVDRCKGRGCGCRTKLHLEAKMTLSMNIPPFPHPAQHEERIMSPACRHVK